MSCAHPLFNVYDIFDFALWQLLGAHLRLVCFRLLRTLKVTPEMLQKGHLLLELLRILGQSVFLSNILTVARSALIIVKVVAVGIQDNLGRIVEVYTCGFI